MTKAFGILIEYILGVLLIAKIFLRHIKNIIVSPENTNIVNFSDWEKVHHG